MLNHKSPLHFLLLPVVIFLFEMVLTSCDTAPKGRVEVVSAATVATQLSTSNLQLVDVRTAAEFAQGTIKGAVNIDVKETTTFKDKMEQFDKNKPVYIFCQAGGRSKKAAAQLLEMGFTTIYDFSGGYSNWSSQHNNQ